MARRKSSNDSVAVTVVKFALSCLLVVAVAGFVTDWFGYGDKLPLPSMSTVNDSMARSRLRKVAEQHLDALMDPSSPEFVAVVTGGKATSGKLMEQEVIPYVSYADMMGVITENMDYEITSVTVDNGEAVIHATVTNGDVVGALDEWCKTMGDRTKWPQELREMADEYDALPAKTDKAKREEKEKKLESKLYDWGWQLFRELVDKHKDDVRSNDVTLTYKKMDDGVWGYAGESGMTAAILGGSEFELVKVLLSGSIA